MTVMALEHTPVLLEESVALLDVQPDGVYVDATIGLGGHAEAILGRLGRTGRLIGLDRDKAALEMTRERLQNRYPQLELHQENFKNLPLVLSSKGIQEMNGCLLDLGVSSYQLTSPERGFSFREAGPLDMRMDFSQRVTAARLVNELPEEKLAEIFRLYGEEPSARKLAAAIVRERRIRLFQTTDQLAELVESIKGPRRGRLHPATQVFQALRIEVNNELEGLDEFLTATLQLLVPGGRLVVISFHSLEDRIVKQVFQREAGRCICFRPAPLCRCPRRERVRILTRKPVTPSAEEVIRNPRARSAKLRAVARKGD